MGHSEEVVAFALRTWSVRGPTFSRNAGLRWDEQAYVHHNLTAASIRHECEDSLADYNIDIIDLLFKSIGRRKTWKKAWSAMAQLQKEGKVRWIGVSNFNVEDASRARHRSDYSLATAVLVSSPRSRAGDFAYCQSERPGVIVYSPMASGLLTGAMTRERAAGLPSSDWRSLRCRIQRTEALREPRAGRALAGSRRTPRTSTGSGRRSHRALQKPSPAGQLSARETRSKSKEMSAQPSFI